MKLTIIMLSLMLLLCATAQADPQFIPMPGYSKQYNYFTPDGYQGTLHRNTRNKVDLYDEDGYKGTLEKGFGDNWHYYTPDGYQGILQGSD